MTRKTVAFLALLAVLAFSAVRTRAATNNSSYNPNEHLQAPSQAASSQSGFNGFANLLHPDQWQWLKKFSLIDPNSWPFIPVPEVATDPNSGTTVGMLVAFLQTNKRHEITSIFAPDVETNTTLGPGGTFRYLAYPSEDTQWYAVGGIQQKIARFVDVDYQTGLTRQGRWSFEGRFYFERDPTDRFFGVGNNSRFGNQTNYTDEEVFGLATLGYNFNPNLQLSYTFRPRYYRIMRGAFTNLPSISTLFPNQKGLNGGTEVLNVAMLSYDTRDSIEIPRSGGLARVFAGFADRAFMSSMSYTRFGAEVRRYYSLNRRITLVGHVFVEYEPAGNEMPWWTMASLGGEPSLLWDQQTLRGYGAGRFVDNNLAVANFEMRTRVYEMDIFGTHGILELAPFFDIGRVGHSMSYDPFEDTHPVGGIGFRGIAEPFVVGYVDIGFGGEGAAVFSGINYPF